jgi:hypothetical protein
MRSSVAAPIAGDPGARFVADAVAGRPAGRGRMRSSAEARFLRVAAAVGRVDVLLLHALSGRVGVAAASLEDE